MNRGQGGCDLAGLLQNEKRAHGPRNGWRNGRRHPTEKGPKIAEKWPSTWLDVMGKFWGGPGKFRGSLENSPASRQNCLQFGVFCLFQGFCGRREYRKSLVNMRFSLISQNLKEGKGRVLTWLCPSIVALCFKRVQSTPDLATWLACYRMGDRPRTKNVREMAGGPRKVGESLEAQQRYFSYRAILVAIVSQNSFVLVLMGYVSTKGGVSHHFGGGTNLP